MKKDDLILIEIVDGIGRTTNKSLTEMMEIGKKIIDDFRAHPANAQAILEASQNMFNRNYKISKYGEKESMFLFVNNVIYLFQIQRENIYKEMPSDEGLLFWREVTNFYMTYTMASLYCMDTKMTTMADVSKAIAELRDYFLGDYLMQYVKYMK